jgi:hypothetical protein
MKAECPVRVPGARWAGTRERGGGASELLSMDARVKPGHDGLRNAAAANPSMLRRAIGGREFAGDAAVPLELLCLDAEFRRQHAQPAGHREVEGGAGEVEEGFRLPQQVSRGHVCRLPSLARAFLCRLSDIKPVGPTPFHGES